MARAAAIAAALALLVAAVAATTLPPTQLPARVAQGTTDVAGSDTRLLTQFTRKLVFELQQPSKSRCFCPAKVELDSPLPAELKEISSCSWRVRSTEIVVRTRLWSSRDPRGYP